MKWHWWRIAGIVTVFLLFFNVPLRDLLSNYPISEMYLSTWVGNRIPALIGILIAWYWWSQRWSRQDEAEDLALNPDAPTRENPGKTPP